MIDCTKCDQYQECMRYGKRVCLKDDDGKYYCAECGCELNYTPEYPDDDNLCLDCQDTANQIFNDEEV